MGQRWTLLVVRELVFGPKRYSDLLEGLPGMGPNVLAERLKRLEAEGIIERRTLAPPSASKVYDLTDLGRGLEPVVMSLFQWGLNFMEIPAGGEGLRLGWLIGAIQSNFDPEAARGVRESYEFRVDGETFNVAVDDGTLRVEAGPASDPALTVTTDLMTFIALGQMSAEEAGRSDKVTIEGDPAARRRCARILSPRARRSQRSVEPVAG